MAARTTKKARARKTTRKPSRRRAARRRPHPGGILRLDARLPSSLREVRTRMRANLSRLEKEVERTRALYRRRATRLLREASHRLGRLEALGERGWRDLGTRARRELAALLRRLEHAVEPAPRRSPRRKKA